VRILVPVKQVAHLKGDATLDGAGALPAGALERSLNEWDAFAMEAALRLLECDGPGEVELEGEGGVDGNGEVVVVTVGDEPAEAVLLSCLAMGADRAIRVWDPALEDADPLAVAAVLAAVAAVEEPELILCGAQSSDAANAATGVALAGVLDLPRVAVVSGIEADVVAEGEGEESAAGLLVQRELEGGAVEVLRITTPALLTIQTGINQPRRANLRAIKRAREKPLARLVLADLGMDGAGIAQAGGSRTVRLLERPQGERASMIEGDPGVIAQRIAELVGEAMGP
jgi:electron transfer flavoprotein beta subunit